MTVVNSAGQIRYHLLCGWRKIICLMAVLLLDACALRTIVGDCDRIMLQIELREQSDLMDR